MKSMVLCVAAASAFFGLCRLAPGQSPPDRRLSPETVRLIGSLEGPELYKAYCAVCHGASGKGGGPMAAALKVEPADLSKIAVHNGGVYPLRKVEKIIGGEDIRTAGHGTQAMPIW